VVEHPSRTTALPRPIRTSLASARYTLSIGTKLHAKGRALIPLPLLLARLRLAECRRTSFAMSRWGRSQPASQRSAVIQLGLRATTFVLPFDDISQMVGPVRHTRVGWPQILGKQMTWPALAPRDRGLTGRRVVCGALAGMRRVANRGMVVTKMSYISFIL